jgi:cysteinyl-tRNA synthetase
LEDLQVKQDVMKQSSSRLDQDLYQADIIREQLKNQGYELFM